MVWVFQGHNVSSWPEKAHSDPTLLLRLGHSSAVFACRSFAIQITPVHNSSSIRSWWERKDMIQERRGCEMWFFFMEGGREGKHFRVFLTSNSDCTNFKRCSQFWPLIAHIMHFYLFVEEIFFLYILWLKCPTHNTLLRFSILEPYSER